MKVERGRPVITREDYPEVIFHALLGSMAYYSATMTRDTAASWCHTAQNSYETLQDVFGVSHDGTHEDWPDRGDATLYMSLDQLELALVNYGCTQIDTDGAPESVVCVDALLRKIDGAK